MIVCALVIEVCCWLVPPGWTRSARAISAPSVKKPKLVPAPKGNVTSAKAWARFLRASLLHLSPLKEARPCRSCMVPMANGCETIKQADVIPYRGWSGSWLLLLPVAPFQNIMLLVSGDTSVLARVPMFPASNSKVMIQTSPKRKISVQRVFPKGQKQHLWSRTTSGPPKGKLISDSKMC